MYQSINPTSGEPLRSFALHTQSELQDKLTQSQTGFQNWAKRSFQERAACFLKIAEQLRAQKDTLALLMTDEMGKPIGQARGEIDKCAWVCTYYAEQAEAMLQPEPVATEANKSYICFQPLGAILAIMPWNFPFWQVFRFAAPTLMAGNVALLKHAENVGGCAEAIEKLFHACFPPGVFQNLFVDIPTVESLIQAPAVQAVTLTGSVRAGRAVASQAGAALKKVVLELGGSDPYLILADADLDAAVKAGAFSRLLNSGQTCIAAKRFIVDKAILPDFQSKLKAAFEEQVMGDPHSETTTLGPQARADLREQLNAQVAACLKQGAQCLLGGVLPQGPGYFYPPTILTDVQPGMPAWDEEIFGPVAAIIPATDTEEAIRIANDSPYGLGAAVFTANIAQGEAIARGQLQAGACFVNDFVKSDPRLPFGGVKSSGLGRELGAYGIKEFVNIKTVYIAASE